MAGDNNGELTTKQRVLESACRLFAEKGYRDATVHEICEEAHANIAAVNYYFGGKDKLYDAAWRHAYQQTTEARGPTLGAASERTAEEQIRHFVRGRLDDVSSDGPASYFWQILGKEHAEPTFDHRSIFLAVFKPLGERLMGLMKVLLGEGASDTQAWLCVFSLIGQIVFFMHHRRMSERALGKEAPGPFDPETVCDHLIRFSFGGIRATRSAVEDARAAVD